MVAFLWGATVIHNADTVIKAAESMWVLLPLWGPRWSSIPHCHHDQSEAYHIVLASGNNGSRQGCLHVAVNHLVFEFFCTIIICSVATCKVISPPQLSELPLQPTHPLFLLQWGQFLYTVWLAGVCLWIHYPCLGRVFFGEMVWISDEKKMIFSPQIKFFQMLFWC